MSIRSTCKAIVIHQGKVLLNKCHDEYNGQYYSLPGGGQETLEFLDEAIVREVLEETGYTVKPERFAGLGEEICTSEEIVRDWPDYIHKMYHIYVCSLLDKPRVEPTEVDDMQDESVWVDIEEASKSKLLPEMVGKNLLKMINGDAPMFLDSVRVEHHHG